MIKILFYANRSFHLPHLEPIASWMKKNRKEIEVCFSSPVKGLRENDVSDLVEKGFLWKEKKEIKKWAPDISILADVIYKKVSWGGKKVNVNHGLICKGFYYTRSRFAKRDNAADLVCVPGRYHENIMSQILDVPVLATGFVKFDKYVNGEVSQKIARTKYGIPVEAKVVTFAPTFNWELSAVPVVTHQIRRLTENGSYLLIKLHELSSSKWYKLYRLLAEKEERVVFVEDNDVTASLVAADIVISDVSSVSMEAMALDKPVILVDSPFQKKFYNYNKNDIEFAWRDFAVRVKSIDELCIAVQRCIDRPEEKRQLRYKYGPELVGELDGNASQRTAEAIIELVKS